MSERDITQEGIEFRARMTESQTWKDLEKILAEKEVRVEGAWIEEDSNGEWVMTAWVFWDGDKILPDVLERFRPPVVYCEMGRPDDWGTYADLKIPLSRHVRLKVSSATLASYGGGLRSNLDELGYRRGAWLDVGWGKGEYVLLSED